MWNNEVEKSLLSGLMTPYAAATMAEQLAGARIRYLQGTGSDAGVAVRNSQCHTPPLTPAKPEGLTLLPWPCEFSGDGETWGPCGWIPGKS